MVEEDISTNLCPLGSDVNKCTSLGFKAKDLSVKDLKIGPKGPRTKPGTSNSRKIWKKSLHHDINTT